jgi:hypothetical protein
MPKLIDQKMELNYPVQQPPQLKEAIDGIFEHVRGRGLVECVSLECVFNNRRTGCYLVGAQIRHGVCLHYNDKISADEIFPYMDSRLYLFKHQDKEAQLKAEKGLPAAPE